MLLVEFTINSVLNYLSIDGHALTHNWKPRIIGFDAPMIGIPTDHGGYGKLEFGTIQFNPILFQSDWPPPINGLIEIYYTDTDEASRELVFSGIAHRNTFDREQVSYALHGPDYDETIADSTAYNDTLNVVMTAILTSIAEITTVNTTAARAVSPNVAHTTSGVQLAIDLASAIAEFYSHLFYVIGDTAYLVDMKRDNGSRTLTEFQYFAFPAYPNKNPVAVARCGTFSRFSTYPYGDELAVDQYHTTEANVNAAPDDIIALENAARSSINIPMIAGNFVNLGEKINFTDTGNVANLTSWIRARNIRFDFMNDEINIEGEGAISA